MTCKCSYTINNYQPVTCSLIDDVPLFCNSYVDDGDTINIGAAAGFKEEEEEFDEEEFNPPSFVYTEKHIEDKEFKDYLFNCQLTSFLSNGYVLMYSESEDIVTIEGNLINVPRTMDKAEAYIYILRVIRINKTLNSFNLLSYDPDSSILLNRVLEADVMAFSLRGAWEVRLKGWEGPWEYLSYHYPDLAYSFITCVQSDFRFLRNGEAMRSVFEAWFLGDYVNEVDSQTVKILLKAEAYYNTYNKWLPLSVRDICLIAEVSDGVSYTSGLNAETVLTDSVFNAVRDRKCANFIWFMRFEKRFRETEEGLGQGEEGCNVIPINT